MSCRNILRRSLKRIVTLVTSRLRKSVCARKLNNKSRLMKIRRLSLDNETLRKKLKDQEKVIQIQGVAMKKISRELDKVKKCVHDLAIAVFGKYISCFVGFDFCFRPLLPSVFLLDFACRRGSGGD